jgi:beta-glucanase (GH16 family)
MVSVSGQISSRKESKVNYQIARCTYIAVGFLLLISPVRAQSQYDPSTTQTFEQVVAGMQPMHWYNFGVGAGSTISNLSQLAAVFNPYGIASTSTIHQEWEVYQPFNAQNHVFTQQSLDLTATLPYGVPFPGGINSGQIFTQETFQPGLYGKNVYAFMVRAKIPNGPGTWPGIWLYTKQPGLDDGSEIDDPEFFVMTNQNQFDWTGYNHGPGVGPTIYSIMTNQWVWQPGVDFSAGYHDYELVWTPDATFKYVDGQLILAQYFWWTAPGPAQFGIDLAVGSSASDLPGLIPTSASEFPATFSIQYISIWAK